VTFADWVKESVRRFRLDPPDVATKSSAHAFYAGAKKRYYRFVREHRERENPGVPVFEHDWDVLVVLDTLRPEALRAVADDYDYLPDEIGTTKSVGEMSRTWLHNNFVDTYPDEKARTAHVTWNAFSDFELEADNWHVLDEVWREVWDDDLGCLPPEAMTAHAREAYQDVDADRYLVHIMQPHAPYRSIRGTERLTHEEVGKADAGRETIWDWLRRGKISRDEAWDAYLDNLRWALDALPQFLEAIDEDDRVLLTADHGECFGEYGLYGHPEGTLVPELVEVPLTEIDATGVDEQGPTTDETVTTENVDVEQRLADLGYR
jgi:hypothetical protein